MASLKSLLGSKSLPITESNLEKGKIYSYQNAHIYDRMCCGGRFCAPADGTVVLEIWGAGGSGAEMCCCGGGIGGNTGAYAKKTFGIRQGEMICSWIGRSCASDDLCFKGCSEATCVMAVMDCCGNQNNGYFCMCAEGGKGGINICSTGTALFCCFYQCFCGTRIGNDGCGTICNWCADGSGWHGQAYGGDVNCPSRISCTTFLGCCTQCICQYSYHIAYPYGVWSTEGGIATHGNDHDSDFSQWSGQGQFQRVQSMNSMSRHPTSGVWGTDCWGSSNSCGCYNMQGCHYFGPYGSGGVTGVPCPNVRDHGSRGGSGLVRVKFIE